MMYIEQKYSDMERKQKVTLESGERNKEGC